MFTNILSLNKRARDATNCPYHKPVSMKNYEEDELMSTRSYRQERMNDAFEQAYFSLGNVYPKEKTKPMPFIPNPKDLQFLTLLGLETIADYRMGASGDEAPHAIPSCAICDTHVSPTWHPYTDGAESMILCDECQKRSLDVEIAKKRLRYTEKLLLFHKRINQPQLTDIYPRAAP